MCAAELRNPSFILMFQCLSYFITNSNSAQLFHVDSSYDGYGCYSAATGLGTARSAMECSGRCDRNIQCRSFFYSKQDKFCYGLKIILDTKTDCIGVLGARYYTVTVSAPTSTTSPYMTSATTTLLPVTPTTTNILKTITTTTTHTPETTTTTIIPPETTTTTTLPVTTKPPKKTTTTINPPETTITTTITTLPITTTITNILETTTTINHPETTATTTTIPHETTTTTTTLPVATTTNAPKITTTNSHETTTTTTKQPVTTKTTTNPPEMTTITNPPKTTTTTTSPGTTTTKKQVTTTYTKTEQTVPTATAFVKYRSGCKESTDCEYILAVCLFEVCVCGHGLNFNRTTQTCVLDSIVKTESLDSDLVMNTFRR